MLFTLHHLIVKLVIFAFIKKSQQESGRKKAHCRLRDAFFRHQPLLKRLQQMQISHATIQIASRIQRHSGRLFRSGGHHMMLMKISDRPAIRHKMPLEIPLSTQNTANQCLTSAARLPVRPVISAHHRLHMRFFDKRLECRQICFLHIFRVGLCIKLMAQRLRSGMHREMLRARRRLHDLTISLQALDESNTQSGSQIRILSIGLMSPSPSGIPENIDIRRPERKPFIDIPVIVGRILIVFRPALSGHTFPNLACQLFVKCRRDTDRLWKHCRRPCSGHTVQALSPPVIGRNAKPLYGRRLIPKLSHTLLHCHLRH